MHIALLAALLCAAAEPSTPAAPDSAPSFEEAVKAPRKTKKVPMAGVLNINRASAAELTLLPGIGKGRAKAILERREKKPFASLDELARLKGMRGVVRKQRAHLAVQGDTTLHPLAAAAPTRP